MNYIIVLDDLPGEFRAESANEAARKVRALHSLGKHPTVRDQDGHVFDLRALDEIAERERAHKKGV